ncbi:MAG: hypothetical protein K1X28_00205 [Parachlamydiales bacterium]|nr:hypothetical protein [Parachlamydiales bacterium]
MNAIPSFTQVVHDGYNIVFQGDGFKDLESVEEVLVAINHGSGAKGHTSAIEDHCILFEDGDALLFEAQRCLLQRKIKVIGSSVTSIDTYGWDHIYDGKDFADHTPEFWTFYETESWCRYGLQKAEKLFRDSKVEKIQQQAQQRIQELTQQLKDLTSNSRREEFIKRAIENWDNRQDSLMTALEVLGNLRKLAQMDGPIMVNPYCVFRRSVLLAGRSHLINVPGLFTELHESVDKVRAFLKKRNAIIIEPKK